MKSFNSTNNKPIPCSILRNTGVVNVDKRDGRVSIDVDRDFVKYYNWFITKKYWTIFQTPKWGAHITLVNPTVNRNADIDAVKHYHGQTVEFFYSPFLIEGGFTKGFVMFYLNIICDAGEEIMDKAKVHNKLHLTICNSKQQTKEYFPEMISIVQSY